MTMGPRLPAWGVALGAMLLIAAPAQADPAPGEYTIGFVTDNTGPVASAGQSYHRGAQLAVSEINQGALIGKGVAIKLYEKESGSDPARTIQAVQQFMADRAVVAVTCCVLSPVAGAVKPLVIAGQMPLVIYGSALPGLPQRPYVYSVVGLPGPAENRMTNAIVDAIKPATVLHFVTADNEAAKARLSRAQGVLTQRGIKDIGVVNVLSADTDFAAAATQGKAENPDLIMIWATQIPAAGIISALRQRGFEKTIAATDAIATNAVFKKTGEPLAGVVFPVIFTADLPATPAAQAFVRNFESKWKEVPDTYAAQGYTAIYLLAQAMKAVDGPLSREAIATQLSKITAITTDVFGGIALNDGQAEVPNSLVATWTKTGKIRAWNGK